MALACAKDCVAGGQVVRVIELSGDPHRSGEVEGADEGGIDARHAKDGVDIAHRLDMLDLHYK